MSLIFAAIVTGITVFASTNIDDIVILLLFFSQVNDTFRPRHIVIGQYLGFTALIIISLPGFFGGLVVPKAWIGLLGIFPIVIGIKHFLNRKKNAAEVQTVSASSSSLSNRRNVAFSFTNLFSPQSFKVAAVTVANGGDNIGIYVPLFASSNFTSLSLILGIFYLLIGVWCVVAYTLNRKPLVAKILIRYGNIIAPFLLIALGLFILIENKSYELISRVL